MVYYCFFGGWYVDLCGWFSGVGFNGGFDGAPEAESVDEGGLSYGAAAEDAFVEGVVLV